MATPPKKRAGVYRPDPKKVARPNPLPPSMGGKGGGGGKAKAEPKGVGGAPGGSAESRMLARENKAKKAAGDRAMGQAKTIGLQAKALQDALKSGGFRKALQTRLEGVNLQQRQQDAAILEGYGQRVGDLNLQKLDNDSAGADATQANLTNRQRERMMALNEAANMSAGESDVLKSSMASLKSWDANQGEVNRSFFDSLRSINNTLGDLNVDTKTARLNVEQQANSDRDQLWTSYYNQKSETLTQLGNTLGQQAEYYGSAEEQGNGKAAKLQKKAAKDSGRAFRQSAKAATKVHANPGASKALTDWQGAADFEGRNNSSLFENAATNIAPSKKPSGASLRSW